MPVETPGRSAAEAAPSSPGGSAGFARPAAHAQAALAGSAALTSEAALPGLGTYPARELLTSAVDSVPVRALNPSGGPKRYPPSAAESADSASAGAGDLAVQPAAVGRLAAARTWLMLRCGLELRTVVALTVVLVAATGLAVRHYVAGRPHTVAVPAALPSLAPAHSSAPRPSLTIDIAGKVAHPGLRKLPPGSRVADALAAAGGSLPGADTTSLNLARPLTDGEQLLVGQPPPADTATSGSAGIGTGTGTGAGATPLSLNSATAPQLDALPGVGPVLAQHIIDYRTEHGGFTTLQQLRQVPGIGDRKFSSLKSLVHL
ncbi:ComEA family DNA-binding protein [Actinacidiphila epipremni]|nr:ComEA family DNA-binding protein [Actinacidiphila epipremni]